MIDFHSHILPKIDDGSRSTDMSLQMIEALANQGADTIAATSHFYATERTPQRFLELREASWEHLKERLPEGSPRILLGAEVLYFPGISRMDDLPLLCLEGTRLLLLEMPFSAWTESMIREVNELARMGSCTLLMAHIERYFFQQPLSVWDELLEHGVLMQANANFFLPFGTRRKALRLLREGRIHLLGSDCHSMGSRAPHLGEAREMIRRSLGQETLDEIDALGRELLAEGRA